ncbi:lytic transglycosylase domain-containing protein [Hufsiella ginkgonis]|uniref:Transglycosylase SLT domain-containing protein n=1 Tax=Hufsiella ginkgonis TaxID=2695274 RepID=A0A7K1Y234_9SPHI|nr:lytic transglycosylase domain-containing protein [Hufsiella ginkgonis]MXV17320.1 transglycosylase SLT domain-containing protein [Hufsiella ginkgonis]
MKKTFLLVVTCFLLLHTGAAREIKDEDLKKALEALQNQVPLTYNGDVRKFVDVYTTAQKKRFAQMVGLSKYYFPIYEKVFKERGVPDELKYLSVIESSLDPNAVSKAEATGPWQFLNEVGKKYGLAVNDTIDERRDPSMACNAAASYLLDSYAYYGNDWLLAIASYNCGRNSIKWAMEDSGKKDYWSIRKYLPAETRNYVPAYIATVYMMNHYRKYGIVPVEPDFITETEHAMATKKVSIDEIAKLGGLNPYILYTLNPSYKKQMINGSGSSPKKLVVPVLPTYTYNAICRLVGAPERIVAPTVIASAVPAKPFYTVMYTVQAGDSLQSIAAKFNGATIESLKSVNNLKDDAPPPGTMIKVRMQ